ncbi:MAG: glycosyltransferase family 4 protein [Elusimicrobia bacterium]|nr:glycosyltransferase family 4 protein [Elusimicrobiota bacterium]
MRAHAYDMKELIFVAAHVGYPMDRTPLGGGATVGVQLARAWASMEGLRLTVVGSGPEPPAPGVDYIRLPGEPYDLVKLSELGYARFCRRFEAATTAYLRERRAAGARGVVVVNDISEAPDFRSVAAAGWPLVSIWHVDVVDYFNKMYFRGVFAPERFTGAFERLRPYAGWAVPDVLKLVFEKQRQAVKHSRRLVLPSRAMVETLRRCYRPMNGAGVEARSLVVPWGGWSEPADPVSARGGAEALRRHYQLGQRTRVLMTLSRLSPEKGIHLLLEALERLEGDVEGPEDVCLFVCGEAAFMSGTSYEKRLRRAAGRLTRFRVFFPGYVAGADKEAYFAAAQLFVSPSVHDSYGLTVVEALRAGLPVLASDHYGVSEIFAAEGATDPHRGFARAVSYARDPAGALEAELSRLLREPERLKAMGERARRAGLAMTFSTAARSVADAALEVAA